MERLGQIQGAIFDLDGTLLDSTWLWSEIDRKFLAKRGIALPDGYIEAVNAMEFSEAARYTIDRFKLNETPQALVHEWSEMARYAYAHEVEQKPLAKAYLQHLAQRGVKLGIATSSTEDLFIPALKNNGIFHLFSAYTTTKEVSGGKEKPAVYLATAMKLSTNPSDCAVFEDTLTGIRSARRGGFLTVGVYDEASAHDQAAIHSEADIYIREFAELLPPGTCVQNGPGGQTGI